MTTSQELANRLVQRLVNELLDTCEDEIIAKVEELVARGDFDALEEITFLYHSVFGPDVTV